MSSVFNLFGTPYGGSICQAYQAAGMRKLSLDTHLPAYGMMLQRYASFIRRATKDFVGRKQSVDWGIVDEMLAVIQEETKQMRDDLRRAQLLS